MPKIHPTDEPQPSDPAPAPQPQPTTTDQTTASVEQVIEVEETEGPAKSE